ncbi:unnamed protein product, partial [Effrenium voratum]
PWLESVERFTRMAPIAVFLAVFSPVFAAACSRPDDVHLLQVSAKRVQLGNQDEMPSLKRSSCNTCSLPKTALEEHVGFNDSWQYFNHPDPPVEWFQNLDKLLDLSLGHISNRIRVGEEYNVSYMVLSMTGNTQDMHITRMGGPSEHAAIEKIQTWNQKMYEAVKPYPKRLNFWCVLPMFCPSAATKQLEECMDRGSPGALINGFGTDGDGPDVKPNFYDTDGTNGTLNYTFFWKTVEERNAVIYLHPRADQPRPLYEKFPELQGSPWGFSLETAEHILRLMLEGFFDKFPRLRIIIGHDAELLAFWAWRIDHRLEMQGWKRNVVPTTVTFNHSDENGRFKRNLTIEGYLRRNIWATTSGMFDTPSFQHLVAVMGSDRVLFSMDTAYEQLEEAALWFDHATQGMSPGAVADMASGNAQNLLMT